MLFLKEVDHRLINLDHGMPPCIAMVSDFERGQTQPQANFEEF